MNYCGNIWEYEIFTMGNSPNSIGYHGIISTICKYICICIYIYHGKKYIMSVYWDSGIDGNIKYITYMGIIWDLMVISWDMPTI